MKMSHQEEPDQSRSVQVLAPSSSNGSGTNGRLFMQASIWVSTVAASSKVSLVSPTTRLKCVLNLLTAASHRPPKFGERSGINYHCIALDEQKSEISPWVFSSSRN